MPSSNTPNAPLGRNANEITSPSANNKTLVSTTSWYDPASHFGYGLGRLLRGAFDLTWSTWQSWWNHNPAPSHKEIEQRQRDIYVGGLKECIQQLKLALENVRKNPHDPASLRKIADLAQHYAAYVNVVPAMELNVYQQQFFQHIRGQVERLSDSALKWKLSTLLPVLAMGFSEQANRETGSSVQDDEYYVALSQSYYEESTYKKSSEPSFSKGKRSIQQVPLPFPAVFNLSTLDGTNGFTIPGIASGGWLGVSVNTAGDVNGDNITDLVLGANYANSNNGTAYVIFGSRGGFSFPFNLNSLNGSNGFIIPGIASTGQLGISVSTAGDINGDMIADLVLGAYGANSNNGVAYVIFGSRAGFASPFNLNNLNGSNGFTVPGIGGLLGRSVSTAGDINGDMVADLVLGAYGANSNNGTAYVIFGSRGGFSSSFNLSNLNGANGFTIPGVASGGQLGTSVSTAGDVNGDNITDLVLGASSANSNNGTAYVIFGSRGGFAPSFDLTSLNGSNGFMVPGITAGGILSYSVNTAGDINGDNITDLVLGAHNTNSGNGAAYVIFGNRAGFSSSFNLSSLNGSDGFVVPGIVQGGLLGGSVSTAGDINSDNISDIVLGAQNTNSINGTAYVIFGSRGGFSSPFNLANLNGNNGFTVPGIASVGNLGRSVSTAGDINNDNISDLVLGAFNASSGDGAAYVIFGQNIIVAPTPIPAPTQALAPVQLGTIAWVIQANGTTVLTPAQFQVLGNSTQLVNDIFTVEVSQGGYFASSTNLTVALTNFTYPQLEAGQILFVHNGTALPKITLSIGDGVGQPILFSPLVSFSNDNSPSSPSSSLLRIAAGAAAGAVSFAALLTAVGLAAHHRRAKEKEREKAAATPVRNLASVATPLQRKGN